MCGRFTMANEDWSFMFEYFRVTDTGFRVPPQYNIAPTQTVRAIISDGKERRMGPLKWGIIPSWSETDKTTFSTFNARVETILTSPSFRQLVSRKRCIIPADGFIEWQRNTKQPYRIRLKKREIFGLAGLYDSWKSPDGKRVVNSCTIITSQPNIFMANLHDRMPVILPEESHDQWLDRSLTDKQTIVSMLQPYPDALDMYAYKLPALVGSVHNDGPECIERID